MSLQDFLLAIIGQAGVPGTLTYPATNWVIEFLDQQFKFSLSSVGKRWLSMGVSAVLVILASALYLVLGYGQWSPDFIFTACMSWFGAYTLSQAVHGAKVLRKKTI